MIEGSEVKIVKATGVHHLIEVGKTRIAQAADGA